MKNAKTEPLTFEKVWQLFQETDRKFQETKEILRQSSLETDRQILEMKEALRQSKLELDKALLESKRETEKVFRETDKRVRELTDHFDGQWGKLVEALLGPGCLALFKERGIKVTQTYPNVTNEKSGKQKEIDLLLVNDTELVVIEIKSTASVKYIDKLLLDLQEFRQFFPQYKHYKVYGAMAALRYYAACDEYAERKGLFVIKSTGENLIRMQNEKGFKPKAF